MAQTVETSSNISERLTSRILRITIAALFTAVALAKFAGAPPVVAAFDDIGLGQSLRYLIGAIEIIGAAFLFFPRAALYAAIGLHFVAAGATLTHFMHIGGNAAPAIILHVLTLIYIILERHQLPFISKVNA